MFTQSTTGRIIHYLCIATFIVFAIGVLALSQDLFYTVHERSEFLPGSTFFRFQFSQPFGCMQYVGAWLTQFFYHPALGSTILFMLWVLVFAVGCKAYALKGTASSLMLLPVACLLTSVVDLGYWVYIFTYNGYFFSQSLAYLISLFLVWIARSTPRKWHLAFYFLGFCLYPILGWYAMLFIVSLILAARPGWQEWMGGLLLLFAAHFWHALLYSHLKLETVLFAGFPHILNNVDASPRLSAPFYLLATLALLIPLCGRFLQRSYVPLISASAGVLFALSLFYRDSTYTTQMRMVRHAEDNDWSQVLQIADTCTCPTATMVMLKNIALTHQGGLLETSFKSGNKTYPLHNPDTLHVTMLEIASPVICYNYGLMNEGFRLAFECAVQTGFSPYYLKMLASCAHANGEEILAQRYIANLQAHPFYHDWQPEPVSADVQKLQQCYTDELTGVDNTELYIVNYLSRWINTPSRDASEQALFYSMIRCDSRRFWAALRHYVSLHPDENFPEHAQEAYILYMDKAPEEKRIMLPVNEEVYDRYEAFWFAIDNLLKAGYNQQQIERKLRPEYGDTYWYYNIFARKSY